MIQSFGLFCFVLKEKCSRPVNHFFALDSPALEEVNQNQCPGSLAPSSPPRATRLLLHRGRWCVPRVLQHWGQGQQLTHCGAGERHRGLVPGRGSGEPSTLCSPQRGSSGHRPRSQLAVVEPGPWEQLPALQGGRGRAAGRPHLLPRRGCCPLQETAALLASPAPDSHPVLASRPSL